MRKIVVTMLITLMVISCTKKPETDTLLRLGDKYYSLVDFFEDNSKSQFVKIPESSKIKQIENWAENQLILKAAKDREYLKNNTSIKEAMENYQKQADIKYYLDRIILDSIITEDILRDYYDKMSIEVNASHILIQHSGVKKGMQRSREEAFNLAEIIVEKARSGEDFAALSKKYSEDPGSKETGNLGYFGPGKMVKEFEEAAFSMKEGEISDPVSTQFGFHIIKVLARRRKPQKSFEEEKRNISNKLIQKYRPDLQESYKEKVEELKNKYGYKINKEMADSLIAKVEKYKQEKGPKNVYNDISILETIELPDPIGEYNGNDLNLNDLIEKIKQTHMQLPPSYINDRYFMIVMENIFLSEIFLKEFKKSGIPYDDVYLKEMETYKNRVMRNEFKKEMLDAEVKVSDIEIKKYYDENKEEKYKNPSRAETREIFMYDSTEAAKLLDEVLAAPEKFDDFSKELTMRYNQKEKPGYFGKITSSQYGQIGRIANSMQPNTIHPKLVKAGKGWSIIKVYDVNEESIKDLESVKQAINTVLIQQKKIENEKEMMEKLKKQYRYKIYWDCVNIKR